MNDSIKKGFNALFRTVIFCCLIASVMMIVNFVRAYGSAIADDEELVITKEMLITLGSLSSIYRGVFFAGIAAAVLSILSAKYKASGAAVFFRTALIASTVVFMYDGMAVSGAMVDIANVAEVIDLTEFDDIEDVDEDILIDAGIDEDRAEEISEAFEDENAVIPYILSPFLCTAVYFLLSCTSLHNLLKKTGKAADCGGCDDAQRIENFDPSMFNGGHFVQQGMNPMGTNRINNAPPMGQNPYIQNIINAANAAHPAHDHHDSAAAHDLAAEGEFHDYAQAEADMTDDSSDYLSQLQREENRGHRLTDEDFM